MRRLIRLVLRRSRRRALRLERAKWAAERLESENAVLNELLAAQREWITSRQAEDALRGSAAAMEKKRREL